MSWLGALSLRTLSSLSKERIIVVMCNDVRNYFKVVTTLKKHNISFILSTIETRLNFTPDVIITDIELKNFERYRVIKLEEKPVKSSVLLLEVCRAILGKKQLDQIILGVDPGKETGVVMLADGVVVLKRVAYNVASIISMVKEIIELANFQELMIKIGTSPSHRDIVRVLLKLIPKSEKVRIGLVDESRVSKLFRLYSKVIEDKNDNIISAYAICLARNYVELNE